MSEQLSIIDYLIYCFPPMLAIATIHASNSYLVRGYSIRNYGFTFTWLVWLFYVYQSFYDYAGIVVIGMVVLVPSINFFIIFVKRNGLMKDYL